MNFTRKSIECAARIVFAVLHDDRVVNSVASTKLFHSEGYRLLITCLCCSNEVDIVTSDIEVNRIGVISQTEIYERHVLAHIAKCTCDAAFSTQNGVTLARHIGASSLFYINLSATKRCRSTHIDTVTFTGGINFSNISSSRIKCQVAGNLQRANRIARRYDTASTGVKSADEACATKMCAIFNANRAAKECT